jgi:radical SAM superfamily enzyme YgiQ (UPF0313 family)
MKKRRVLLVFPEKVKEFASIYPPLSLCYLASSLKEDGHDVKGVDLRCQSYDEYLNVLKDWKPDWVGVSVETISVHPAKKAINMAKEHGANVVVGGPHVSLNPLDMMDDKNIDLAVIGEGEQIIRDVVADKPYEKIQGLVYRKKGEPVVNPHEHYIENIDDIPLPDRSIFPVDRYFDVGWIEFPLPPPVVTVFGGRGCPYRCTFCAPSLSKIFGDRLRYRSPQNMIQELTELRKELGIRSFYLVDDLPTCNPKWLVEFADLMVKSGLNKDLSWSCNTRSNIMTDELAQKLRQAGCILVMIGIESGSQKVLDFYNKKISPDESRRAAKICQQNGLLVLANIMFGAPIETEDDLDATIKLFKDIDPEMARTTITSPYPGTYLYDTCIKEGWLKEIDYEDYCATKGVPKMKTCVPFEVLTDYQNQAARYAPRIDLFFRRPHYRKIFMRWLRAVLADGHLPKVLFRGIPTYIGYHRMRKAAKGVA